MFIYALTSFYRIMILQQEIFIKLRLYMYYKKERWVRIVSTLRYGHAAKYKILLKLNWREH